MFRPRRSGCICRWWCASDASTFQMGWGGVSLTYICLHRDRGRGRAAGVPAALTASDVAGGAAPCFASRSHGRKIGAMRNLSRLRTITLFGVLVIFCGFFTIAFGAVESGESIVLAVPEYPEQLICPDGWVQWPWPDCNCYPDPPPSGTQEPIPTPTPLFYGSKGVAGADNPGLLDYDVQNYHYADSRIRGLPIWITETGWLGCWYLSGNLTQQREWVQDNYMEDMSRWFEGDPTWQSEHGIPPNPGYDAMFWFYTSSNDAQHPYKCTFLMTSQRSDARLTPLGEFWKGYNPR